LPEGGHDVEAFSFARSWLTSSLSGKGTGLGLQQEQSLLPTRALDLGKHEKPRGLLTRFRSRPDPFTAPIRLISPEVGSTGEYLTLSHRWGESQEFTLNRKTSDSFHVNIPFVSLPKTFQDALTVTRKLGYQYLWIDALRILQDDLQEWLREAPKMPSINSKTTCTIAAHGAKDDSEGFLTAALEPVPSRELPPRPRLNDARFSISQRLTSRSLSPGGSFKEQINESFLTRRG
jgi:hypothetical protein